MVTTQLLWEGLALAILSGVMNGVFTLPMKYLGRWGWENVWSVFILVACVVMPAVIAIVTIPQTFTLLSQAPGRALGAAALTGFIWGFGAILFGQSVSAVGISLANTLVLALGSSFGSALPLLILDRSKVWQPQGQMILGGVAVAVVGISLCGWAGRVRERAGEPEGGRGDMVGKRRPVAIALVFCIIAGLISGLFNIGYSVAQPMIAVAKRAGLDAFAGSNLIWLVMLETGSLANLGFCGWLLVKNRTLRRFAQPASGRLYALSILMGLLWGGSIFVYGAAAPKLGSLGPAIGWPVSLAMGLLVANLCGALTGEWKGAPTAARRGMVAGVVTLVISIAILGRAAG
jgi:L-rhamnose-H+ transport protein